MIWYEEKLASIAMLADEYKGRMMLMAALLKKYAKKPWNKVNSPIENDMQEWRRGTTKNGEYIKIFTNGLIEVGKFQITETGYKDDFRGLWELCNVDAALEFLKQVKDSPFYNENS